MSAEVQQLEGKEVIPFNSVVARYTESQSLAVCSSAEARRRVPHALAEKLDILPLSILSEASGDLLTILACDPLTAEAQKAIQFVANAELSIEMLDDDSRHDVLSRARTLAYGTSADAILERASAIPDRAVPTVVSTDESEMLKLLQSIVHRARCLTATDVILEPTESAVVIRYRVRGTYEATYADAHLSHDVALRLTSCIKVLSGLDITEHRAPQEGGLNFPMAGASVRLRVSIVAAHFGPRVALRLYGTAEGVTRSLADYLVAKAAK